MENRAVVIEIVDNFFMRVSNRNLIALFLTVAAFFVLLPGGMAQENSGATSETKENQDGDDKEGTEESSNAPAKRRKLSASTPPWSEKKASVTGLLVMELGNGSYAGSASKLTATAIPDAEYEQYESPVSFNQDVGDMMDSALREVIKLMIVRHGGIPGGHTVEIGFADHYSPKDGPSAAVACGCLIESMVTGNTIDPKVAITGDMNADGSVQPVGGITAKLRGARMKGSEILIIPKSNQRVLADLALISGLSAVTKTQILSASSFEEIVGAVMVEKRSAEFAEGLEVFKSVQKVMNRQPKRINQLVRNAKVQARLTNVIELIPHHVSARILLAAGRGRLPKSLSLPGSFYYIDQACIPLFEVMNSGNIEQETSGFDKNEFAETVTNLRSVRNKLDKRAWGCADALRDYAEALKQVSTSDARANSARGKVLLSEIRRSAEKVRSEYDALKRDPEIADELANSGS